MTVKDVVTLHRGEVRELPGGSWATCNFDDEFANHPQLRDLVVKPASGGAGGGSQVRMSRAFSVMDLFMALGRTFSAKELYDAYMDQTTFKGFGSLFGGGGGN